MQDHRDPRPEYSQADPDPAASRPGSSKSQAGLLIGLAVIAVVALAGAITWGVSTFVVGSDEELTTDPNPVAEPSGPNGGEPGADDPQGQSVHDLVGECFVEEDLVDPFIDCSDRQAMDVILGVSENGRLTDCLEFDGVHSFRRDESGVLFCTQDVNTEPGVPPNTLEVGECVTSADDGWFRRTDCNGRPTFRVDEVVTIEWRPDGSEEMHRLCAEAGADSELTAYFGIEEETEDDSPDAAIRVFCVSEI